MNTKFVHSHRIPLNQAVFLGCENGEWDFNLYYILLYIFIFFSPLVFSSTFCYRYNIHSHSHRIKSKKRKVNKKSRKKASSLLYFLEFRKRSKKGSGRIESVTDTPHRFENENE